MKIKKCTSCDTDKSRDNFHKRAASKDGLSPKCKACIAEYQRSFSAETKAAKAKASKEWYEANKDRARESRAAYSKRNAARLRGVEKSWRKSNPVRVTTYRSKRRAARLNAILRLDEMDSEFNDLFILEAHDLVRLRNSVTGTKWHVDHIVPLQSKVVCGLHWYANLRVITAKENQMKGNRVWENQW